jgi:O-methyltransferase
MSDDGAVGMTDLAARYLDLMARTLTRYDGVDDFRAEISGATLGFPKNVVGGAMNWLLARWGLETVRRVPFDINLRTEGLDWPMHADTMIGLKRLANVREAVRTVVEENVPGDLVEAGVWRGGASIMMRAALEAYGDESRIVWCADSFEGLPPPELDRYPQDAKSEWHTFAALTASLAQVQHNFEKYGFLDSRVKFLKGWFKDTIPSAPIHKIAVLRLDGDMYASTMDVLLPLYEKVSVGAFVIVDDYGIEECRLAVHDFRAAHGVEDRIVPIDQYGAYWRKGSAASER